jgi:hypothetical protein
VYNYIHMYLPFLVMSVEKKHSSFIQQEFLVFYLKMLPVSKII